MCIMAVRYFTLEEANAVLPKIKPLMAELIERRARIAVSSREIVELLDDTYTDFGGPVAATLTREFESVESLLKQIKSYGCVVKSIHTGLIDFLAKIDGRDVYLCWRFGEESIQYYHELHTGFQGRIRI